MRFSRERTMPPCVNIYRSDMAWGGNEDKEENKKHENTYEVSVVVCTYNQTIERTLYTLKSIITQKEASVQLVVADDGSAENHFGQIEVFLLENGFKDFLLIGSGSNHGTVINLIRGIGEASGHYIKPLSPGDALTDGTALYRWLFHLRGQERKWSFSDAVWYHVDGDGTAQAERRTCPLDIRPYLRKDDRRCRWNYVVLNDIALGAAVLGERDIMLEYLHRIAGKVKLAEDNIWRLMMFDGIMPVYFPEAVLYYEVGSGVSTSGNGIWATRLKRDWDAATHEMLADSDSLDSFQLKIRKGIEIESQGRRLWKLLVRGKIRMALKRRISWRGRER